MFCLQLCMVGCAIRGGGGSSANQRAERLAIEKGKLSETTDPVAQTKSYIVIADILLSFAADAAHEQALGDFRNLLTEYGRTIRTARHHRQLGASRCAPGLYRLRKRIAGGR